MTKRSIMLRALSIFMGLWIITQLAFSSAQLLAFKHGLNHAILEIRTRVALDAAHLDLGDPNTQQSLNEASVEAYLSTLNQKVAEEYGIALLEVLSVQYEPLSKGSLSGDLDLPLFGVSATPLEIRLHSGHADLVMAINVPSIFSHWQFNYFGFLFALGISAFYVKRNEAKEVRRQQRQSMLPSALLHIDLNTKQLVNVGTQQRFDMQNKPLCFFVALVQYCIDNPNAELLHHKDVPESLIKGANKAFARLIELGHTKRKRPDFNANLEKTLSEIRAVLDLVFAQNEKHKAIFYPPRAQGEGSRSKQHSYALHHVEAEKVEIIGL
ncbi:hypothetical protein QTP81_12910 [Alteromonas sp. ASW11-36]|uniref:Uncharacterized protein n=1 Tax=Alteromonas arenosi TaxID=3055817 RepID=A0ABT7SZA4_9ALTE|nr:hypothetical protein [Alteromonas sp. ASW11-36]MDM7861495.1 hypothetical protein [Alteromonas sp. ASW11-36]